MAQQTPSRPLDCRTADLADQQKRDLDAAARFAFQIKKAQNNKAFTGITYVPIRPHIIRQSDGTGGMSLTRLNRLMAQTNRYYLLSGSGIQFFFAGTSPDYIDNTAQYNSFSESSLPTGSDAADAMNMYFIFSPGPNASYAGYAYYPANDLLSTRSVIGNSTDDYLGRVVIPHELGHNFNLYHTFGNNNTGNSAELVTRGAGANCTSAGDLVCDTPADPYIFPGANIQSSSMGCPVYGGTATDANGDGYNPQTGNIMSYYNDSGSACLRFFTAGQYDRMQAGLALRQTHTAYSLNAPATPVTAPTNLVLSLMTGGAVQLTWQDNATNEMGYFVERAIATTGPFAAVGGVPPNTATFTDQTATPGTTYYYRIRPSNTTTGHLSPVQTITTPPAPCLPTYAIGCSDGNGLTGLILNGDTLSRNSGCSLTGYQLFTQRQTALFSGQTYSFTAQLGSATSNAGLAIWIDADRNGRYDTAERRFQSAPELRGQIASSFTIPAGIAPGPVGMRVMTASDPVDIEACGSYRGGEAEDYTLNIISTCPAPGNPVTSLRSPAGAQLTWANAGDGLHYDLLWRISGSENWIYINDVPVPAYNLTGLQPGTAYDWQVRTRCDPVSETAFTTPVSFTTLTTCPDPTNLTTNTPTSTGIRLGWTSTGPGVTYELRYKPQTGTDWITLTGLSSTSQTVTLTNPQPTVVYNWAVRTNCGSTGTTNWVNGPDFGLFCPEPTSLTVSTITDNSAQLQWQNAVGGSGINDLQWRPTTSLIWNTVSGIVGNTYSLTGLQSGLFYNWQVRTVCTAVSNSYYTPTVPFVTGGCQPVFSIGCSYGSGTGLNSFSLNGTALSTNSGCSVSGYGQFTTVATVSPGRSYSLAGTMLNQTTPAGFNIWVDMNRNGIFDSNEIVLSPGQPVTGTFTGAFAVPATLTPGPLSLRIMLIANAYPGSASACGSFVGGEAEDYRLEVIPATGCAPPTLTLSGSATIAAGLSAPLTVLLTGNQPISFTIGNNGTPQTISVPGSSMPMAYYYIPVNPTATTMYFPLSVSNACGTGTGNGSAVITVQNCDAPTGLAETEQTTSSVRLTWQPLVVATDYTVIYRLAGAPTATTTTVSGTNSLALYGLTFGAVYDWQVSSTCSYLQPVFSPIRSFTMGCAVPFNLSEVVTGSSSVRLQWAWPSNFTVEVQYRPAGVSAWTSTTLAGGYFYNLGGLTVGSTYQWRIRTVCSGSSSEYSAIRTFTIPCNAPTLYALNAVTDRTAQLTWYAANGVLYDVRWRAKTPPDEPYTLISGLQGGFSTYATGIANLTGLTSNTAYEWQVRTACSATVVSAFGSVQSFTTLAACPSVHTLKDGSWSDSSVWSCGWTPTAVHDVEVRHSVTLSGSILNQARKVKYGVEGKLIYLPGGRLRLGQ